VACVLARLEDSATSYTLLHVDYSRLARTLPIAGCFAVKRMGKAQRKKKKLLKANLRKQDRRRERVALVCKSESGVFDQSTGAFQGATRRRDVKKRLRVNRSLPFKLLNVHASTFISRLPPAMVNAGYQCHTIMCTTTITLEPRALQASGMVVTWPRFSSSTL
jgi:hypothetical protein